MKYLGGPFEVVEGLVYDLGTLSLIDLITDTAPISGPVLLGRYTSGLGNAQTITLGSGFSFVGGALTYTPSASGTVTSVAITAPAAGLTVSGSPITGAGTFVFALADDLAALEALATTGYAKRTGPNAWTAAPIPFSDLPAINTGTVADVALADILAVYNIAASANRNYAIERIGGFLDPATCEARLTLVSGSSVADASASANLYWTPHLGNRVCLWDGTRWKLYILSEISIAASTMPTAGGIHDVFVYDNSGTLTLVFSTAWTNTTTRADALGLQDGIPCLNSNKTRRWVGTVRAGGLVTGSPTSRALEDTSLQRRVWNKYNQVAKPLLLNAAGGGHTYNGGYQQWGGVTNQVDYVTGEDQTFLLGLAGQQTAGTNGTNPYAIIGISYDSPSAASYILYVSNVSGVTLTTLFPAGKGGHYLGIVESTASLGTSTFTTANLFAGFMG